MHISKHFWGKKTITYCTSTCLLLVEYANDLSTSKNPSNKKMASTAPVLVKVVLR